MHSDTDNKNFSFRNCMHSTAYSRTKSLRRTCKKWKRIIATAVVKLNDEVIPIHTVPSIIFGALRLHRTMIKSHTENIHTT